MEIDREVQVAAPDGSVVRDGRLRNLSARGAKIALSDTGNLPEHVVLHMSADCASWPCRIMRRRESEIGVLFT